MGAADAATQGAYSCSRPRKEAARHAYLVLAHAELISDIVEHERRLHSRVWRCWSRGGSRALAPRPGPQPGLTAPSCSLRQALRRQRAASRWQPHRLAHHDRLALAGALDGAHHRAVASPLLAQQEAARAAGSAHERMPQGSWRRCVRAGACTFRVGRCLCICEMRHSVRVGGNKLTSRIFADAQRGVPGMRAAPAATGFP